MTFGADLACMKGAICFLLSRVTFFFVVNENRIAINTISGTRSKTTSHGWSEDYIKAIKGFKATSNTELIIPEDIPWSDREELL